MALPPELERMRGEDESTVDVQELGPATLAVTDRRVLAFTPETEGKNVRAIERANVERVSGGRSGDRRHLRRAIRPGILGLVLLGASQVVSLDGLDRSTTVPEGTGELGLGGLLGLFEVLFGFLAVLDTLLLAGGLLVSSLALVSIAAYGHSRSRHVRVRVAGEPDIHVRLGPTEPDAGGEAPNPAAILDATLDTAGADTKGA